MGKTTKPNKPKAKKRAEKYDNKLSITGTFEDVIKIAVGRKDEVKPRKNKE